MGSRLEHGGLLVRVALGEPDVEPPRPGFSAPADLDPVRHPGVRTCHLRGCISSQVRQPDEVGVGVQHHDPESRVQEKAFEDGAEGVGLARPGLTAEEGVPVETPRIQVESGPRLEVEPADVQRRPTWPRLLQVRRHALTRGLLHRGGVERRDRSPQDASTAHGHG